MMAIHILTTLAIGVIALWQTLRVRHLIACIRAERALVEIARVGVRISVDVDQESRKQFAEFVLADIDHRIAMIRPVARPGRRP